MSIGGSGSAVVMGFAVSDADDCIFCASSPVSISGRKSPFQSEKFKQMRQHGFWADIREHQISSLIDLNKLYVSGHEDRKYVVIEGITVLYLPETDVARALEELLQRN